MMAVRLFKKEDKMLWDDFVARFLGSSFYHSIEWKRVIETIFGHSTYYLLSEDEEGKINGILPLVHTKVFLFGNFFTSLPYFNYGGVCAETLAVEKNLLDEAVCLAKKTNVSYVEFRQTHELPNILQFKNSKVSMLLDLPVSPKHLWNDFPSKLRSQIRRPEKEGMFARFGQEEELDNFYEVFSINMRDLGTPVYSKLFFKMILETFPKETLICTVYFREKPVASGFLIGFKERLEIPWASALREYNQLSPNMLLYWNCLKYACEKGYQLFDFGRCTPDGGTYYFKEQWGAKPLQLYWHYWMRNNGPLPELNPKNPKYRTAIQIWKCLPVGMTQMIGPTIVKYLP